MAPTAQLPFLDVSSFAREEESPAPGATANSAPGASPFVSIYELEDQGESFDPRSNEYVAFLSEMYDDEMDAALFEVVSEAAALSGSDEWGLAGAAAKGTLRTVDPGGEAFLRRNV